MLRPGIGMASPSKSLSTPAMIFSSVDLPEPFRPSTPILAPGKKLRDTPLRISRFGGTILPRRFIVKTYCAIWVICERDAEIDAARRFARSEPAGRNKGILLARRVILREVAGSTPGKHVAVRGSCACAQD